MRGANCPGVQTQAPSQGEALWRRVGWDLVGESGPWEALNGPGGQWPGGRENHFPFALLAANDKGPHGSVRRWAGPSSLRVWPPAAASTSLTLPDCPKAACPACPPGAKAALPVPLERQGTGRCAAVG